MPDKPELNIEDLWKSLRSVICVIGINKMDPPQANLKCSIVNGKYSIFKRAGDPISHNFFGQFDIAASTGRSCIIEQDGFAKTRRFT